tara:strand:- start:4077 stop:4367 length:291 start_codon:yes stop_codon:yes gene_type:complete
MGSRYKNNEIKKISDGRRVYRSKIYPNIPLRDDDKYVVTQTGDRLDTLAGQYYNDSTLWWIIASANKVHNASVAVDSGTVLRIPQNFIEIQKMFNQ